MPMGRLLLQRLPALQPSHWPQRAMPRILTCSPTRLSSTPGPTAVISPDGSTPMISGNDAPWGDFPARAITSNPRLTETAPTRTRTSPSPGSGSETSSYCITSGGPNSWTTMAFI